MSIAKIISAITCTSLLFCLRANAQQAAAFKDSEGTIFLYGVQPNSSVEIGIAKPLTKAVQANSCGVLLIRSTESFKIDEQIINPNSNFTIRELPKLCSELTGYPVIFKTSSGAIALAGKTPGAAYAVNVPNHKASRLRVANACGFIQLRELQANTLSLPTVTGESADFAVKNLPQSKPLACVKNTLYLPMGFNTSKPVASATITNTSSGGTSTGALTSGSSGSSGSSSATNSQNAQPQAAKTGNKLIVSKIPPGTYTVANASNPQQKKTYTVTSKACLVSDRTTIGSPSKFLISRQGLTFPIDWASLTEIPSAAVPSC